MTPPPPQPGGGMRVGYDIINSPPTPGQQPQGFAALGPAIGSALGGIGLGGMPAPMQNPFLGGQPPQFSSVNTTTTQDIMGRGSSGVPFPQGPGAGISPEMLSRLLQGTPSGANGPYPALASTLPVGDMGQPYITDKGYFGPGTMSNPTGPQFGQEGVVTQVSRPLTGVPQYGGGMGQPRSAEDAWRQHSAMARYAPGADMDKIKQDFIANYNARQGVPQYGDVRGQPYPTGPQYGGGTPFTLPPQVSRPPVNDSRLGQPITSVGRQPPQQRMMPEALQNLRRRIGSGSGGISNLLNRIRG